MIFRTCEGICRRHFVPHFLEVQPLCLVDLTAQRAADVVMLRSTATGVDFVAESDPRGMPLALRIQRAIFCVLL